MLIEHTTDYRAPGQLSERSRAFRVYPEAMVVRTMAFIQEYGLEGVLVAIDAQDRIVSGEPFVEAAKRLGLNRIPVVVLAHLNEVQLRSYAIAVHKIAEMAGWDDIELAAELCDIRDLIGDGDLPELGIDVPELDRLFALGGDPFEEDEAEAVPNGPPVAQGGHHWRMGDRHELLVGSALDRANLQSLVGDEQAQASIVDAPYNLATSNFSTTGRFGDFVQGAGEMSRNEYVRFLTEAMRNCAAVSEDGSLAMWFMSYHFLLELLRAGGIAYDQLKTIITWDKGSPGLGSLYRARSEFIALFKLGSKPHRLHANARNRSTIWEYPSLSTFSAERDQLLGSHPSIKSLDLIADAILDVSDPGGIVLDCFAGSGTLALACERTGRRARMIELEPAYADVALRRFRKATGIEPVLISSGETLAELEEEARDQANSVVEGVNDEQG